MLSIYRKTKYIEVILSGGDLQKFLKEPLEERCFDEKINKINLKVVLDYSKRLKKDRFSKEGGSLHITLCKDNYFRLCRDKAIFFSYDGVHGASIYLKEF